MQMNERDLSLTIDVNVNRSLIVHYLPISGDPSTVAGVVCHFSIWKMKTSAQFILLFTTFIVSIRLNIISEFSKLHELRFCHISFQNIFVAHKFEYYAVD